ncbi:MAG TPA: ABC transporter ATP-binding protein, partial [Thermodesulfovibrionales bacterium]|nr:ABC transporter ATP-binding protein [Thermodesulfovibrionales bacterium]
TTLLRAILGLAKPASGTIRIFGKSPDKVLKSGSVFGYLPQISKISADFPVRVIDVVMMGRYGRVGMLRWPGEEDRKKSLEYIAMMGIEDLKNVPFGQLSGGQQQRASIARALAGEPKILILDEPNTGIDVIGQEDFYHLLKGLQKRFQITTLMASHDIGAITAYVDEIACLNNTFHYQGSPVGALSEDVLTGLYGKNVDLLMHTDVCEKCERLRRT